MKSYLLLFALLISNCTFAQSQWQPLNGPFMGGWVNCIEARDSIVYAGTDCGLYATVSKGNLWYKVSSTLNNVKIRDIKFYGQNIFIATSDSGIYMSDDMGVTWATKNNGLTGLKITSLLVHDTLIFAGSENFGVFVTSDQGQNWAGANNGISAGTVNCLASLDTMIYAGSAAQGIYISHNNGNSWSASNSGLFPNNINSIANDSNFIFVSSSTGGVYRSDDYGSSWMYKSPGTSCRAAYMHDGIVYVSKSTGEISRSIDYGDSWTTLTNGLPANNILIDAIHYSDSTIYVGSWGGGVYTSNNNGNLWQQKHNGMKGTVKDVMAMGNHIYAATNGDGICWSDNGGNFWNPANIGLPNRNIFCLAHVGTKLFAGGSSGLFSSVNYGISWDTVPYVNGAVTALTVYDGNLYVGKSQYPQLSYTIDTGATWVQVAVGITTTCNSISRQGTDLMVGLLSTPTGFYSNDQGGTWNQIPIPATIAATAFTSNFAIAGSLSIYKSILTGTNWIPANNGYPSNIGTATMHSNSNIVYVGGPRGIYFTDSTVSVWQNLSEGLSYLNTQCITSDSGNLYAATDDGVWMRSALISSDEVDVSNQLSKFRIYPNPNQGQFNVVCDEMCLSSTIEITDVLGKVIYKNHFQNLENSSIDLNSKSSGVYLMRIISGNRSTFQKIIVQQ